MKAVRRPALPWLVVAGWLFVQPGLASDVATLCLTPFRYIEDLVPTSRILNTPDAGLEQLPMAVRDARALLTEARVTRYRISTELAANQEFWQRLIESAWPAQIDSRAPVVVLSSGAAIPDGCEAAGERGGVKIAVCH